jgi:hypothetical protein
MFLLLFIFTILLPFIFFTKCKSKVTGLIAIKKQRLKKETGQPHEI